MTDSDSENDRALANIEEFGCHILHVLEDDFGPCFTYSIGIEKTSDHPELLVTGLKREIAHWIINEYNNRVRDGETFVPATAYSDFLEGFDVQFRKVHKTHYDDYFGWGQWLYDGNDFRVHQLVFPSTSGKWPWDNDAPEDYISFLPPLDRPV